MPAHRLWQDHALGATVLKDPGDGGKLPVSKHGLVEIVTSGAETRTLADPKVAGVRLGIIFRYDGGNCVISCASAINSVGHDTITLDSEGDFVELFSVKTDSQYYWRQIANVGANIA